MSAAPRMSVIERLAGLPDVFDLGLFCLTTSLDRNSAKVMVSRWAAKGYLDLAGPKSGVYFKRLAASLDQSEQTAAAVQLLYPSATVCGASVLHRCAWTTQVPRELHVAIEARPSVTSLNGVVLHQRSLDWFRTIAQHQGFEAAPRRVAQTPSAQLRVLKPAFALADLYASQDGWVPDDDDLDLPEDNTALNAAVQALVCFEEGRQQRRWIKRLSG